MLLTAPPVAAVGFTLNGIGISLLVIATSFVLGVSGSISAQRFNAEVWPAAWYQRSLWRWQAVGFLIPPAGIAMSMTYFLKVRPRLVTAERGLRPSWLRGYPASALPDLGNREPGWYPDPEVEPIRVRWWDGLAWTSETLRSRNYGWARPVRQGRGRGLNQLWVALAIFPLAFGASYLVTHVIGDTGDPTGVYVTALGREENPKIVIAAHCRTSVLSVRHYQGYVGTGPLQRWSVAPVAGHVGIAYFNVDSGQVTCP
jgi:hypothetical protein